VINTFSKVTDKNQHINFRSFTCIPTVNILRKKSGKHSHSHHKKLIKYLGRNLSKEEKDL
jgi:hypothetical protein